MRPAAEMHIEYEPYITERFRPQSGQSGNVERLEDRVNADPVAAAGCNAKGARPVAQPRQIAGPTGAAASRHNNSQPSNENPRVRYHARHESIIRHSEKRLEKGSERRGWVRHGLKKAP